MYLVVTKHTAGVYNYNPGFYDEFVLFYNTKRGKGNISNSLYRINCKFYRIICTSLEALFLSLVKTIIYSER